MEQPPLPACTFPQCHIILSSGFKTSAHLGVSLCSIVLYCTNPFIPYLYFLLLSTFQYSVRIYVPTNACASTVMRPLMISFCIAHCTETSERDYCQLNQIHTTRYIKIISTTQRTANYNTVMSTITRLTEVWLTKTCKRRINGTPACLTWLEKMLHSRETESNRRPKDASQFIHYSPPLYQLSYREYTV